MARDLERDLRRSDDLTRRIDLLALGHTKSALRSAVRSGRLWIPRRGWVCGTNAPPNAVRAVVLGGRLGGASALESYGIWVDEADELTIAVQPTSSRLPTLAGNERRLWVELQFPETADRPWRVSVRDAPLEYAHVVDRDSLVASLDSALYTRKLQPAQVDELLARLPERLRAIRNELDGRAMSGTESKMRLALIRAGLRVEIQVRIQDVGIVDLLVDAWLIVEVDSHMHHGEPIQQHKDRVRDGISVLKGFGFLRFDYVLVQFEREWCVGVVLTRLASGRP